MNLEPQNTKNSRNFQKLKNYISILCFPKVFLFSWSDFFTSLFFLSKKTRPIIRALDRTKCNYFWIILAELYKTSNDLSGCTPFFLLNYKNSDLFLEQLIESRSFKENERGSQKTLVTITKMDKINLSALGKKLKQKIFFGILNQTNKLNIGLKNHQILFFLNDTNFLDSQSSIHLMGHFFREPKAKFKQIRTLPLLSFYNHVYKVLSKRATLDLLKNILQILIHCLGDVLFETKFFNQIPFCQISKFLYSDFFSLRTTKLGINLKKRFLLLGSNGFIKLEFNLTTIFFRETRFQYLNEISAIYRKRIKDLSFYFFDHSLTIIYRFAVYNLIKRSFFKLHTLNFLWLKQKVNEEILLMIEKNILSNKHSIRTYLMKFRPTKFNGFTRLNILFDLMILIETCNDRNYYLDDLIVYFYIFKDRIQTNPKFMDGINTLIEKVYCWSFRSNNSYARIFKPNNYTSFYTKKRKMIKNHKNNFELKWKLLNLTFPKTFELKSFRMDVLKKTSRPCYIRFYCNSIRESYLKLKSKARLSISGSENSRFIKPKNPQWVCENKSIHSFEVSSFKVSSIKNSNNKKKHFYRIDENFWDFYLSKDQLKDLGNRDKVEKIGYCISCNFSETSQKICSIRKGQSEKMSNPITSSLIFPRKSYSLKRQNEILKFNPLDTCLSNPFFRLQRKNLGELIKTYSLAIKKNSFKKMIGFSNNLKVILNYLSSTKRKPYFGFFDLRTIKNLQKTFLKVKLTYNPISEIFSHFFRVNLGTQMIPLPVKIIETLPTIRGVISFRKGISKLTKILKEGEKILNKKVNVNFFLTFKIFLSYHMKKCSPQENKKNNDFLKWISNFGFPNVGNYKTISSKKKRNNITSSISKGSIWKTWTKLDRNSAMEGDLAQNKNYFKNNFFNVTKIFGNPKFTSNLKLFFLKFFFSLGNKIMEKQKIKGFVAEREKKNYVGLMKFPLIFSKNQILKFQKNKIGDLNTCLEIFLFISIKKVLNLCKFSKHAFLGNLFKFLLFCLIHLETRLLHRGKIFKCSPSKILKLMYWIGEWENYSNRNRKFFIEAFKLFILMEPSFQVLDIGCFLKSSLVFSYFSICQEKSKLIKIICTRLKYEKIFSLFPGIIFTLSPFKKLNLQKEIGFFLKTNYELLIFPKFETLNFIFSEDVGNSFGALNSEIPLDSKIMFSYSVDNIYRKYHLILETILPSMFLRNAKLLYRGQKIKKNLTFSKLYLYRKIDKKNFELVFGAFAFFWLNSSKKKINMKHLLLLNEFSRKFRIDFFGFGFLLISSLNENLRIEENFNPEKTLKNKKSQNLILMAEIKISKKNFYYLVLKNRTTQKIEPPNGNTLKKHRFYPIYSCGLEKKLAYYKGEWGRNFKSNGQKILKFFIPFEPYSSSTPRDLSLQSYLLFFLEIEKIFKFPKRLTSGKNFLLKKKKNFVKNKNLFFWNFLVSKNFPSRYFLSKNSICLTIIIFAGKSNKNKFLNGPYYPSMDISSMKFDLFGNKLFFQEIDNFNCYFDHSDITNGKLKLKNYQELKKLILFQRISEKNSKFLLSKSWLANFFMGAIFRFNFPIGRILRIFKQYRNRNISVNPDLIFALKNVNFFFWRLSKCKKKPNLKFLYLAFSLFFGKKFSWFPIFQQTNQIKSNSFNPSLKIHIQNRYTERFLINLKDFLQKTFTLIQDQGELVNNRPDLLQKIFYLDLNQVIRGFTFSQNLKVLYKFGFKHKNSFLTKEHKYLNPISLLFLDLANFYISFFRNSYFVCFFWLNICDMEFKYEKFFEVNFETGFFDFPWLHFHPSVFKNYLAVSTISRKPKLLKKNTDKIISYSKIKKESEFFYVLTQIFGIQSFSLEQYFENSRFYNTSILRILGSQYLGGKSSEEYLGADKIKPDYQTLRVYIFFIDRILKFNPFVFIQNYDPISSVSKVSGFSSFLSFFKKDTCISSFLWVLNTLKSI